jgi:stress-induced morphogen
LRRRPPRVDQHRCVYDALAEPLSEGTMHELRITTKGEA